MPDINTLIEAYREIYQSKNRDFNILSTIHLSENDHTNILCEILNIQVGGRKPFMESFMQDVLGIKYTGYEKLVAKTQVKSKGNNKIGYIDLLIEEKENPATRIIIENKVCGAHDSHNQLARYYYTYANTEYTNDYAYLKQAVEEYRRDNGITPSNEENVWIVYLTDLTIDEKAKYLEDFDRAEKQPHIDSISTELVDKIRKISRYLHISYEDHLYEWLKNKVLPCIPYGKKGDAHKSIVLYLRELENVLGANNVQNTWYLENNKVRRFIETYIESQSMTNTEKYNELNKTYNVLRNEAKKANQKDNIILLDLISCVLCHRDNVFGQYAPSGWTVYCAGNYITFYPTYWLSKFGGTKTSCIHFIIAPWKKRGNKIKLNLDVHNSACITYMTKNEQTYKAIQSSIYGIADNHILNQDDNLYNKGYDEVLTKFHQSGHYYWHVAFDVKEMGILWDPNDAEAIKKFFEDIISHNSIQELIQYIDNNFK